MYPNPDKIDVVQAGKGDCGGLSWVFIRALRANSVPARLLLGRWADSGVPAKDGQPFDGKYHAKAEFFAQGLGWVGVDMSGGVSTGNPLTCFGNEPGDFVVLDLDIERVVPILAGDPPTKLGGTQSMYFWYWGNAAKVLMNEKNWTVETLEQQPARPFGRVGSGHPLPGLTSSRRNPRPRRNREPGTCRGKMQGKPSPRPHGALLSLPEAQEGVADPDQIAAVQRHRLPDRHVVDEGAAGGTGVADQVAIALPHDASVQPVHRGVAEHADVARLRPADGQHRFVERQFTALAETGLDPEPGILEDNLGDADH